MSALILLRFRRYINHLLTYLLTYMSAWPTNLCYASDALVVSGPVKKNSGKTKDLSTIVWRPKNFRKGLTEAASFLVLCQNSKWR